MKLIHKDGREVKVGDEVISFRGEVTTVLSIEAPRSPASNGHVTTGLGRHYPSVYGLEWIEREDRLYPFTVMLLYPDYLASQYGEETYLAHVLASGVEDAIKAAQEEAANHNLDAGEEVEEVADSFRALAVFAGHLEDLYL